jgi:3-hydroxybutyryl-CoA dehydrogenase
VIRSVGIVGAGAMGAGIAGAVAATGRLTVLVDRSQELADRGRETAVAVAARAAKAGRIPEDVPDRVRENLRTSTKYAELVDCDLVIEAVPEELGIKQDVVRSLEEVLAPAAVIASNTSSIPISSIAAVAQRPERVVGIHFFNPVDRMRVVELVPGVLTSSAVLERCSSFLVDDLGKTVIRSPDRAGFVVNALLVPYLLSAIRMLEQGMASAHDIDQGMVGGCGHPMGPLALCDLVGLDVVAHVGESLFAEFGEAHLSPPPLLRRMVAAGLLGRKSGRGFFDYPAQV